MFKYSIIICALLLSSIVIGQDKNPRLSGTTITTYNSSKTAEVDGTPYIDSDFKPAKINDQDVVYSARYNAYSGNMEVMSKNSEDAIALDKSGDYSVTFTASNKVYKSFRFIDENGNNKNEFLIEAHSSGEFAVLVRQKINLIEAQKARTSYDSDKNAKYSREKDEYYILLKNEKIVPVPRKSKELVGLMPEKEDEIEAFVKDNKIKTKDEGDLKKFVNFISSL